jgi:acyl-CoA synthetase (AMP-forming)/AMP-acid ligase II
VKKFRLLNTSIALENLYGPTEGTIYASGFSLSKWSDKRNVPIGKPLQNTALYIFDRNLVPVPIGVPGELCIAGDGLARGYVNNPELTGEKFDHDLFDYQDYHDKYNRSHTSYKSYISKKIYKTGDLSRWLADGNIQFLGRIDHQVKIRGFRIELEEIKVQLLNHPLIKEAVVIAREEKEETNEEKYLCAYVVWKKAFNLSELNDYLARYLPYYMVPSFITPLEKIPLTTSGKVNRKALPEPGLKPGKEYTAPRNETEKKLVRIWSGVLARDPLHAAQLLSSIGIDDNFFQLGGHSLKATILVSQLHKELDVHIPLCRCPASGKERILCPIIGPKTVIYSPADGTHRCGLQYA